MLFFVTHHPGKIEAAHRHLDVQGITFEVKDVEMFEIQSESIEDVSQSKAQQAYEQLKQPLFVSDVGWYIPSLNGFPGHYMKYMNDWFRSQDFLNLMRDKENREILFHEVITYIDEKGWKSFSQNKKGIILKELQGEGRYPSDEIISLSDTGKSIAQCRAEGIKPSDNILMWEEFISFLRLNLTKK